MNPKSLFRRAVLLAAVSTAFVAAHADTLDNIRAAKKIRVSVDLAVPPSGMTDANMNTINDLSRLPSASASADCPDLRNIYSYIGMSRGSVYYCQFDTNVILTVG